MLQKVSQFDLECFWLITFRNLSPVVIRKQQLGLFSTGDRPLCDLLSDVASKLARLELVAEEDHVVGFDDRVDVDLGDLGYNDTSPIGF